MDRPSFLIYKSFYKPIKNLSNEDKGKLFTAIFELQTQDFDGPEQVIEPQIHMAFEFFKNQFELDNKKWEKRVEANRTNGKKGGRPKNSVEDVATDEKPSEPNETNRFINNPIKTKKGEKEIEIEKGIEKGIEKENKKKRTKQGITPTQPIFFSTRAQFFSFNISFNKQFFYRKTTVLNSITSIK